MAFETPDFDGNYVAACKGVYPPLPWTVQTYDGTAKRVSVSTMPPGLTVGLTYNGSNVAPTNPGTYTVVGTIDDLNYFGGTTNTLLVGLGPVIHTQPVSRTNNLGTTATFNVLADGTPIVLSMAQRRNQLQRPAQSHPYLDQRPEE